MHELLRRTQNLLGTALSPLFGPLLGPLFDPPGRITLPALAQSRDHFRHFDQGLCLEEYEFAVVDTELTGLSPRSDEIVSIGAVLIRNMRIEPEERFFTLVRPRMDLPKLSTLIHHITPSEVAEAPSLAEALPAFVEFCRGRLIVGHHVGLDMGFLNKALRKHFGAGLNTPCLDTMRLAQAYEEELWEGFYDQFNRKLSYHLPDLADAFGLPRFPDHHALMDAMQAAYLFLYLARKLRKGRIETLKDLHLAAKPRRFL
ncbi:MAG: 3'-5' exonuclease [Desulfovibrionaceae bacterium]